MSNNKDDGKIDLLWLLPYLLDRWRTLAAIAGAVLALTVVRYVATPKLYQCDVSILPTNVSSNSLGALGDLANMGGFNVGKALGKSNLDVPVEVYEKVVKSTPSCLRLMEVPMTWTEPTDTVMSMLAHAELKLAPGFLDYLLAYTIRLPWTLMGLMAGPPEPVEADLGNVGGGDTKQEVRVLTLDQPRQDCLSDLRGRILIEEDEVFEGMYRLTATGPNARQSAELAQAVIVELRARVSEFSRLRQKRQLRYLEERLAETTADYSRVRHDFYEYRASHRNQIEERQPYEGQVLQDTHDILYELVRSLQQQVEQQRLLLTDDTPPFSVVDPPVVPQKKAQPRLGQSLLVGAMLAVVLAVGFVLLQLAWLQFQKPKRYRQIVEQYYPKEHDDEA